MQITELISITLSEFFESIFSPCASVARPLCGCSIQRARTLDNCNKGHSKPTRPRRQLQFRPRGRVAIPRLAL